MPDYPTETLPAVAQTLVELGAKHGLPPALVGGAALSALATAVGSGAEIQVAKTWEERAILWVPLIAPAGAGKSPAQKLAYAPLRAYDESLPGEDHPLLHGDLTLEALARNLNEEDSAALDIDELSTLLRGLGEYKRGGGGDRGRFLALWTGHPWRYTRVGGGGKPTNQVNLRAARPTVVICGGLQTRLHELLGGEDDGARPRWLPHLAQLPGQVGDLSDRHPPIGWERLLTGELVPQRQEPRVWTLSPAARVAFHAHRSDWKRQARETSGAVSAALTKADVHLARVTLVSAEAGRPGVGGEVGTDLVERATAVVNFALDCWRALPEQGSLSLSWRDTKLDEGVERLRIWLEEHGGEASRRELQRSRVAGVRTGTDLDQLLDPLRGHIPTCVAEAAQGHGGLPTVVVRAPARKPPTPALSPLVTPRVAGAPSSRRDGPRGTVTTGDTVAAVTPPGGTAGDGETQAEGARAPEATGELPSPAAPPAPGHGLASHGDTTGGQGEPPGRPPDPRLAAATALVAKEGS